MKSRGLMTLTVALAAATFLAGAVPADAAPKKKGHFVAGLDGLTLVETPHYKIYGRYKRLSEYREVLEAVWKESNRLLPRVGVMFETGDVRAEPELGEDGKLLPKGYIRVVPRRVVPGKAEPKEKRTPLKLTVIIVEDTRDFKTVGMSMLGNVKSPEEREAAEAGLDVSPTCLSSDGCTRVYRRNISGIQAKQFKNLLVHCSAADLMALNQGDGRAGPFWLTASYGFYMEFKLFKKSHTLYFDYEEYYRGSAESARDTGGKFDEKDTLGVGIRWAPVLKRLMKKGKKGDLKEVLSADTGNLTPEKCGYMYALMCYLVSDSRHAASFAQFLMDFRDADVNDPSELLVRNYECATIENLQAFWHTFIMSRSFR